MRIPAPSFRHLHRLTDAGGLYEHAEGTTPRREHGYCVDDVARALVVLAREPSLAREDRDLRAHYLAFVLQAQDHDGRFRNRRAADLNWGGQPSVEDCWGRGLWGLGAVVSCEDAPELRAAALAAFSSGARWRSPWSRAMAFAGLGAAAVLAVEPGHAGARKLLADAAETIGGPSEEPGWLWPEARLTYANAALPEVLLAAGHLLEDPRKLADGLQLLGWLLAAQTVGGQLSVVPVGGRGPRDRPPAFDQQPIEVAALADACARAFTLTRDARWAAGIGLSASWFLGANDAGVGLYDKKSGGGCDGLEADGRNENQGAESTLALISVFQQARALTLANR